MHNTGDKIYIEYGHNAYAVVIKIHKISDSVVLYHLLFDDGHEAILGLD